MRLEVEFSCGWVKYIGALLFHMMSLELPCNLVLLEMKARACFGGMHVGYTECDLVKP